MAHKNEITLTVDVVVAVGDHVIVERRAIPPFMDRLVLPGGHVDPTDQSLAHAASRELLEETGLDVSPYHLHLLTVLDDPDRDPRGRYVSVAYFTELDNTVEGVRPLLKAASDAREVQLVPFSQLAVDNMGFDHYLAIAAYLGRPR